MSGVSDHPREFVGCVECGAESSTWTRKRRLPQLGQTYECADCGHEVYVYDAGDGGHESIQQWRPVTDSIATNVQFYDEVGEWPDAALEALFKHGLERAEAIDYHMVEREGLSQSEWGRRRGASQQAVSQNIAKAHAKLEQTSD